MTLKQLFETRRLEVFLAGTTTIMGAWLIMPFASMSTPAFDTVLHAAPEWLWGWLFFFNGLSHMLALAINGRRWWSPFVRWFAAIVSCGVYGGFALGFAVQSWVTTGVPIYSCLSGAAALCMYFAWVDARLALRVKYARRANHA